MGEKFNATEIIEKMAAVFSGLSVEQQNEVFIGLRKAVIKIRKDFIEEKQKEHEERAKYLEAAQYTRDHILMGAYENDPGKQVY